MSCHLLARDRFARTLVCVTAAALVSSVASPRLHGVDGKRVAPAIRTDARLLPPSRIRGADVGPAVARVRSGERPAVPARAILRLEPKKPGRERPASPAAM
jgi:hypothetical protein